MSFSTPEGRYSSTSKVIVIGWSGVPPNATISSPGLARPDERISLLPSLPRPKTR